MRIVSLVFAVSLAGACTSAPLEVVLQQGLRGYAGVDDCFLYAPSSVADINFGKSEGLTAGINRWGEAYVALIRFDLRDLPRGAKIQRARLELYANSDLYPYKETQVQAAAILPANAGWTEGEGTGVRVPVSGTPCWNWLAYGARRWAGAPGLAQPGVDYDAAASATVLLTPRQEGWATFELPIALVQRWLDEPESNAGLRLWPLQAKEKGDMLAVAASDSRNAEHRPRLVLELAPDPAVAAGLQRMELGWRLRDLAGLLAVYRGLVEQQGSPRRATERLRRLEQELGALQASVEAGGPGTRWEELTASAAGLGAGLAQAQAYLSGDLAAEYNQEHGLPLDFGLGLATSMQKVFGRDVPFLGPFGDTLTIEAAGNEEEGGQLVLVPIAQDLEGVTWELTPFVGEAGNVETQVVPVGYVKSDTPALTTPTSPSEWWPDPLLSFLDTFDCPRGQVQPLWVSARVPAGTRPGLYETTLRVRARNARERKVRVRLRVYGFDVPRQQHLKTVWGMSEGNFARFYADRYDEKLAWRYFDLFLAHRMAPGDLYRTAPTGRKGSDSVYHLGSVEAQRKLIEAGSGWWNVGYVLAPQHALKGEVKSYEEYLTGCVVTLREEMARVRAAGWPEGSYGIYFLDETSDFEALAQAARAMRESFPGVPLMTTGYDRSYGVLRDSPVADVLDIWVPLTPRYHEDWERIREGRKLGKQVWWYTCCGPRGPRDLNWFIQFPAVRARLLMGAATWKYQPDGYLYYRVAGWGYNDRPIAGGPYTEWLPRYHPGLPDGDGMLICAGPDGPLTTVRLENVRDGIEDYEYWWVLRDLAERLPDRAQETGAEELLDVPETLLKSVTEYSEEPADLYRVRREVARAIVLMGGTR